MAVTAQLLYPDLSFLGTISLVAGSTATGYALTAMQDGNASSTWKSATLTGANTIKIDLGSSQAVAALAIIGHNLYSARNAGATYTDIKVERSTDDVTWTTVVRSDTQTSQRITSDLPWACYVGTTARYLRITLTDPVGARAYAPEIADLFVAGYALDLTEPTGLPWTPHDLKLVSRTTGSDLGMGIPSVPAHATSKVKVEIGPQAIDHEFFDDLVPSADYPKADAGPSFAHFVRTCYTLGARFVYAPFYDSAEPRWTLTFTLLFGETEAEAADTLLGLTSGAECVAVSDATLVSGTTYEVIVKQWNGLTWTVGEVLAASNRAPPDQAFGEVVSFADLSGNDRHWLGMQIVRAGDGTAKIRTPFVSSWRRKLSVDMVGSGEWMRR